MEVQAAGWTPAHRQLLPHPPAQGPGRPEQRSADDHDHAALQQSGGNKRIQIIHSVDGANTDKGTIVDNVPLSEFEDEWVHVREEMHYTYNGYYSIKPPGACMTPSNVMNSETISFLM